MKVKKFNMQDNWVKGIVWIENPDYQNSKEFEYAIKYDIFK